MNLRTTLHGLVAATGLLALTPTPRAHACSGSTCAPDFFLPFEGSVPANTPGIQWWPGKREGVGGDALHETEASDLTFRCLNSAGTTRDVAFTVTDASTASATMRLIVPDAPLILGEHCEIAVQLDPCESGIYGSDGPPQHLREHARFHVSATTDQPSTLGTLGGGAAIQNATLSTLDGSCSAQVEVCGAAVQVQLDPATAPWADSLVFTTYVDDEPWAVQGDANAANPTGGSFFGRGEDLIFLRNDNTGGRGIAEVGLHTIQIRATLVGTNVSLETPVMHADIDCDYEQEVAIDAGVDASGGEHWIDASEDPMVKPKSSGGCSVARGTTPAFASWLMLVVIGAFATRRRVMRREHAVGVRGPHA